MSEMLSLLHYRKKTKKKVGHAEYYKNYIIVEYEIE